MRIYTVIEINGTPVNIVLKLREDNTHPLLHILEHLKLIGYQDIRNLKCHRGTKLKGRPILQYTRQPPPKTK